MDVSVSTANNPEQSDRILNNGRGNRRPRRVYYSGNSTRNTTNEPSQNQQRRGRGGYNGRNGRGRFSTNRRHDRQTDPRYPQAEDESKNDAASSEARSALSEPESPNVTVLEDSLKDLSLREANMKLFLQATYDCSICFLKIKSRDPIWSCDKCYGSFHLNCMIKWANAGLENRDNEQATCSAWKCPHCQKVHTTSTNPLTYRCFCGKVSRPEYRPGVSTMPHGCDEVCGKSKANLNAKVLDNPRIPPCPHNCTELCHPGPCPPCTALVQLSCPCGRVVKTTRCGEELPLPCGAPCGRPLTKDRCSFGTHVCPLNCHDGECPPCDKLIKSVCYCGRQDEVVRCGSVEAKRYSLFELHTVYEGDLELCDVEMFFKGTDEEKSALLATPNGSLTALFVGTVFSCEQRCDRPLTCEHHSCMDICHPGECKSCPLLPENCVTCPCGRVPLSKLVMNGNIHGNRRSCIDPIPLCPNICERPNPICGHPCPEKCHQGPECPPCKLTTQINCRCGKSSKEIPCYEYALAVKNDPTSIQFLCNRVCAKKKTCGRHKCNRKCCDMVMHSCQETCGRTLSCGKHICEDRCHCGPCGSCWRGVIYEEIYCHCGYTCLYPPQPCGTKPPECDQPCNRQHACTHDVRHNCHSDPECPKCTELTVKRCVGDHTWMYNVPCFITVITCGNVCDKPIPGCSHRCQRQCHSGDCLPELQNCTQPCANRRAGCGHLCGQPCHEVKGITCEVAYRNSKCEVLIALVCSCGFRKEEQRCCQVKGLVANLSQKDPNFLLRQPTVPGLPFGLPTNEILPCDNSCAMAKRLAEGKTKGEAEATTSKMWPRGIHAIDGMQLSAFPPPEYPDNLKQYASNNSTFVNTVEEVFCDIVQQALDSLKPNEHGVILPGKVITHNFNPMPRDKRWFIKELAEFYCIQCVEMDPKPNTFVQAIAKAGWAKFPGGTSKRNCVTLSSQIEASFVGTVKLNPCVQKPVHVSQRPAPLRCDKNSSAAERRLLAFNAIASEASKTN